MIRILLVDDQALLCEVLKTWLEVETDFKVIGTADNGEKAIEQVAALKPDILLIDIEMPGMDGLTATQKISQDYPETKIIVLSAHDSDSYMLKSIRAGAKGYLLKSTTAQELAKTIRSVYEGKQENAPITNVNAIDLAVIQAQIERLMQKHKQEIQVYLDNSKNDIIDWSEIENKFKIRFSELETGIESTWKQFRNDLLRVENDLESVNRNVGDRVDRQVNKVKTDLEQQFAVALQEWARERSALQEWAVQRDEMQPSLQDFETKYKNEMMTALNPLRASVRDMDKQTRIMRSGLFVSIGASALALCFASWVFVSNLNSVGGDSKLQNQQTLQPSR
jgi:DNA-binding NarL/FixJ family response regulator